MCENAFSNVLSMVFLCEQNPLRIVHILRAPMGGVLRHVRDLATAHAAQGHLVGIICDVPGTPGYNETILKELQPQLALGLLRTPMSRAIGPSDILATVKIRHLIKNLKPDVVHGHGAKGGVYARFGGTLATGNSYRPARIYSLHGGSLHYDPQSRNGKIYFQVERALERLTDYLIFVASFEHMTYEEKISAPSCPFEVIYNGLAEKEFDPVSPIR
ncbi:MAG: glycosyltransferase family 4 protein [Ahrensia sp.]|nr:glycosyltransferase family 4 protein [Ahrensia sp.]